MRTADGAVLPDLVVGGVYKCGTTSLFDWLTRHPAIVGSQPKEPNFLRDEPDRVSMKRHRATDPGYWSTGLDTYSRCWPRIEPGARAMEATPFYVFSETAREVLSSLPVPPVFVVLVRRPAMRVRSIYNAARFKQAKTPPAADFPAFVEEMLSDGGPARYDAFPQLKTALRHSDYPAFLEPWTSGYPGVVMVVQMERMLREPAHVAREICTELGIDGGLEVWDGAEITNSNPGLDGTTSGRAQVLRTGRRLLRRLPGPLRSGAHRITPHLRWLVYPRRLTPAPIRPEEIPALERLDAHFEHVVPWMSERFADFRPELWNR